MLQFATMTVSNTPIAQKRWTASELRKLPAGQRDAILRAAAARAETEYRTDGDLTAFDAFGNKDLHGGSASAETR